MADQEQCIREMVEAWKMHNERCNAAGLKASLTERAEIFAVAFLPSIRKNFPIFRRDQDWQLWSILLTAILLAHTHPNDSAREEVRELKRRHFVNRESPPILD
jgi:hypothetical protein